MSPFPITLLLRHPYAKYSERHKHFAPTELVVPPYSAPSIPYRWMLSEFAREIAEEHALPYRQEVEQRVVEMTGFGETWVQDRDNQLLLLDTFYSAIVPKRSLCFVYAKRTPLTDDPARTIVGVGLVDDVRATKEYDYQGKGLLRSVIWERVISHSIRPDAAAGVLLPYQQLLELAKADPTIDTAEFVVRAPDDAWLEFGYGSEHVSHDAAIMSLLEVSRVLDLVKTRVPGEWEARQAWVDQQLNGLWQMRGPFPGLGSALSAFGLPRANMVAMAIEQHVGANEDPWPLIDQLFSARGSVTELDVPIDRTIAKKWVALHEERRELLKLLARFQLTAEQATRFYSKTDREHARIEVLDRQLLENPYLLYELDRQSADPISVGVIDRGAFPEDVVRTKHPMPEPSAPDGPFDERRVRALVASELESGARDGHTLMSQDRVIDAIRTSTLSPPCKLDADLMAVVEDEFRGTIERVELADETRAYQLTRLERAREEDPSAGHQAPPARPHRDRRRLACAS